MLFDTGLFKPFATLTIWRDTMAFHFCHIVILLVATNIKMVTSICFGTLILKFV